MKKKIKRSPQKRTEKSSAPAPLPREIQQRREVIQKKLEQLREYKRLLAEEGLVPDREDKERESRLIQQLLGIEKDQSRREALKRRSSPSTSSSHRKKVVPQRTAKTEISKDTPSRRVIP